MRRKQTDEHGSDPRLEPHALTRPRRAGPICPEGKPDESGWRGPTLSAPPALATDLKLSRVLTDRHDLSALSISQLSGRRWSLDNR